NAIAGGQAVAHHAGVLAIRDQNASPEPRQSGATLERAGLQQALEFLAGLFLGDSVYQRDFSAEAIERQHVQLPFAETLAGVARSKKITSDLRDRDDISGFDFAFVFLSKPGPVAAAFPGSSAQNLFHSLDSGEIRWPAHSDVRGFPDGNADGHFALREKDHEELQVRSGNGLLFNRQNLSHAVRRIDDEVRRLEFQANLPVFARTGRRRGGVRRLRETTGFHILIVQAHVAVRLLRVLYRLIANHTANYLSVLVAAARFAPSSLLQHH